MRREEIDQFCVLGKDVTLADGDEYSGLGCAQMAA